MRPWMKELIVPLLMLVGVAAYWIDASSLSSVALAFPTALMVVILAAVAIILVQIFGSARRPLEASVPIDQQLDEAAGFSGFMRPWSIVLLPLPLIFFWREFGALPALLVFAGGLMFILGERRLLWLFFLPAALVVPTYLLFKIVLYVRLPQIPFGWL